MSPNHHDWERADIYQDENAKLRADNERLREQVDALRLVATSHEPEALRLQADNERLMLAIRSTASDGTYDESAIRKAVSFELAELIVDARRALEPKP